MPRWLMEIGTPSGLRSRAFASSNLARGTIYIAGIQNMAKFVDSRSCLDTDMLK